MKIEHLTKSYNGKKILDDVCLELPDNALVCVLGPSGSGKTTLCNIIFGLEAADSGTVSGFSPQRPSFIFQENRLLPWATACENVAFVSDSCSHWLNMMGLGDDADKYPSELSGGMKRRVAIARSLAHDGDAYLLDEPLTGLDAHLKAGVMDILKRELSGKPAFMITHDEAEVEYMKPAAIVRL